MSDDRITQQTGSQESVPTLDLGNIDLTCLKCNKDGKGTYTLPIVCYNCGIVGTGTWSKTHTAGTERCPRCETRSLIRRRTA